MQRSRRGYKQKPPRRQTRGRPKHVYVKRGSRPIEVADALVTADDNMTPEQMESWREKIKQDK